MGFLVLKDCSMARDLRTCQECLSSRPRTISLSGRRLRVETVPRTSAVGLAHGLEAVWTVRIQASSPTDCAEAS